VNQYGYDCLRTGCSVAEDCSVTYGEFHDAENVVSVEVKYVGLRVKYV
jgi:hypothetical protein